MTYKTKPGIVLTNICGVMLLIPTRAASESCPAVLRLNAFDCTIWETIQKGMPMENATRVFKILQKSKTDEEIQSQMTDIIKRFCDKGVLIASEDKTE